MHARGPRSSSDQGKSRSIVSAEISEKKHNTFSETNCFVIDPIAQEQSIKYHNKESRCWRQIQVEELLLELPSSLSGSVENVVNKGILACALAKEDLDLSYSSMSVSSWVKLHLG